MLTLTETIPSLYKFVVEVNDSYSRTLIDGQIRYVVRVTVRMLCDDFTVSMPILESRTAPAALHNCGPVGNLYMDELQEGSTVIAVAHELAEELAANWQTLMAAEVARYEAIYQEMDLDGYHIYIDRLREQMAAGYFMLDHPELVEDFSAMIKDGTPTYDAIQIVLDLNA